LADCPYCSYYCSNGKYNSDGMAFAAAGISAVDVAVAGTPAVDVAGVGISACIPSEVVGQAACIPDSNNRGRGIHVCCNCLAFYGAARRKIS